MTPEAIRHRMEEKGLRPTRQRMAVYEFLLRHPIHPTAETICRELTAAGEEFSRATVYNSLNKLAEVGLIRVLTLEAEEQRFDGNADEHGHFRCLRCGCVLDFPIDWNAFPLPCPEGCEIGRREVFTTGLCRECKELS